VAMLAKRMARATHAKRDRRADTVRC
jgi:hypothetical protein